MKYALSIIIVCFGLSVVLGIIKTQDLIQLKKDKKELIVTTSKLVKQSVLQREAMNSISEGWQHLVNNNKALVTQYVQLEAAYQTEKQNIKTKTKIVYRNGSQKPLKLPQGQFFLKTKDGSLNEIKSLLWSYKDFRVTLSGDAVKQTVTYKLHQKFSGQLLEMRKPDGTYSNLIEMWELDGKGEKLNKLNVSKFSVKKVDPLANRMIWWNPKFDIGLGMTLNLSRDVGWIGDLGLSLSSYGKTTNDLSWKFFRLGAGVSDETFSLSFTPVMYNLGNHVPIISDLWISSFVGMLPLKTNNPMFGLQLSTTF